MSFDLIHLRFAGGHIAVPANSTINLGNEATTARAMQPSEVGTINIGGVQVTVWKA